VRHNANLASELVITQLKLKSTGSFLGYVLSHSSHGWLSLDDDQQDWGAENEYEDR
jgi:hypothetical protein